MSNDTKSHCGTTRAIQSLALLIASTTKLWSSGKIKSFLVTYLILRTISEYLEQG